MTSDLNARLDAYIEANMERWIQELATLCAQPSVSAQNLGIAECAALVAAMVRQRGFEVEILPTAGHPVVLGEAPGAAARTLLFYNHYDVQPAEPLELWTSPPWEPTLRDGSLYARGVSDDKGHILCRLAAIDAVKAVTGGLPCRVKFLIEGEEEVSSVNLPPFIEAHKARLAADACVWEFGGVNHQEVPMQYLGMRGICYVELRVRTASQDAHSGLGGSIFPNAAWRLTWALASLKGPDERVRIPGFYDNVRAPSARDLELLAALPDQAADLRSRYGLSGFLKGLEGGLALKQAEVFEPTCTICGLSSGYQGMGAKTVLPAEASAKVDFRMVPDQTPEEVVRKLRAHLDAEGFEDVGVTLLGGEAPGRTDLDDPFVQLVVDAAADVYDAPMMRVPMIGGSGPNHAFLEHLQLPICTSGVGYPGNNVHAPDEHIRLPDLQRGIRHTARILTAFGG